MRCRRPERRSSAWRRASLDHYGRVDILVNNAGEIQVGPVREHEHRRFRARHAASCSGAPCIRRWRCCRSSQTRKSGRVVNITSIGGKVAVPHLLPYTCAKFAAVGFSEGLHAELRDSGVKVVTIAPGLMRTGSYLNADFKGDREKESAWFGISSSMPGLTISGERAARQIVDATSRGTAEKVLTTPGESCWRGRTASRRASRRRCSGVIDKLPCRRDRARRSTRGHETRSLQSPADFGADGPGPNGREAVPAACRRRGRNRTTADVVAPIQSGGRVTMLLLLILLIVLLFATVPAWPYSRGWGYYPSGGLGLVVLILVILLLMGRI